MSKNNGMTTPSLRLLWSSMCILCAIAVMLSSHDASAALFVSESPEYPATIRTESRTSRPAIDREALCQMPGALPPEHTSTAGVTGTGREIRLDVIVGLDHISRDRGKEIFEKAAEAYEPLGIVLDPTFTKASLPVLHRNPQGAPAIEVHYATAMMRAKVGGAVPPHADAAYLATNKDIFLVENGERNYGYGGYAECIGGIREPATAVAIGEGSFAGENDTIGGVVRPFMNASAKIAAHELGHLLGGRHEEANCVEGIPSGLVPDGDVMSPCTLMWSFLGASINFGTLEALVVRGYAEQFATP